MKSLPKSFNQRVLALAMLAAGGALSLSAYALPEAGAAKADCAAMHGKHGKHGHKNHAERMEQRAKHLTALKAKLNLTAQQEAAWNAFTASKPGQMRSMADRQAMRTEMANMTTPQRVDKMLERAEARRANMIERAQATKTFYAQLTPAQQAVFDAEAKFKGHGRGGHMQKS